MTQQNNGQTRKKRVTIHDIAREAGVSIGTVSRALNNAYGVDPETRDRVLALSRQLGMRSRQAGKSLHVAVIALDRDKTPPVGFNSSLVYELMYELAVRGVALTLVPESRAKSVTEHIYDGVLCASWEPEVWAELSKLDHTPVVLLNRLEPEKRFHVVLWDHVTEGRTVAEYLLRLGHTRPAFIATGGLNSVSVRHRLEGFRTACRKAGCELPPERIELLQSRSLLFAAVKRVVDQRADAIFLPGEHMLAAEALSILNLIDVKVPEEISIVGGEVPLFSELLNPPLTTIESPIRELAETAVNHLMSLVDHHRTKPMEVLLPTRIIERKSVRDRRTQGRK